MKSRIKREINHFSHMDHIWWGALTSAGQKRYDNKYSSLLKYCKPKRRSKILEIGAGDGEFTKRLSQLSAEIIATDITPFVVKKGVKLFKKNSTNARIRFKVANAEKLPFPKDKFDIVCGISILHHIDSNKALKEAFRVLKKGGKIFFTEPNLLNPNIYLGLKIGFLRKRMEFSDDEIALVRWDMEQILKNIGFSKVVVKNYDFLHPSTPDFLISAVENMGIILEKTPLVKEISGSLLIWAQK